MIINDTYEVKTLDESNVALIKIGIAQKGKNIGEKTETIVGYYTTISQALKAMAKKEIFGTGIKDLETVNVKIELLYRYIDNALNKKGDKNESK